MKLTVQYNNNKFINNIGTLRISHLSIDMVSVDGILYQLFYQQKFSHMVFVESIVTNEILQFISEFFQQVKIFIYHDKQPNMDFINTYGSTIRHIIQSPIKLNNCINLPKLINNQIFYDKKEKKDDSIVCFLDNLSETDISNKLVPILYPSNKEKIKLFNSPNFKHPQNLGLLSEEDKAYILQKSSSFISINDEYVAEALACGCDILDHNLNKIAIDNNQFLSSYVSYETFIKELING
jgi:hypothetical protein